MQKRIASFGFALVCVYSGNVLASANAANDALKGMPESQQAMFLGQMTGHDCDGTRAFLRGLATSGKGKGNAFWSVGCSNGESYSIELEPGGDGTVLDCKIVQAAGQDCFRKLKP